MHENSVVIVQHKRLNDRADWTTKDHCMLPKNVNFICQLPDNPQSTSGGLITSGGVVPPSTLSDPLYAFVISNLPVGTKKIINNYDWDCVLSYENQLGVLQECDNLVDFWGLTQSPELNFRPQSHVEPRQHRAKTNSFFKFEKQQFLAVSNNLLLNLSDDNFQKSSIGGRKQRAGK